MNGFEVTIPGWLIVGFLLLLSAAGLALFLSIVGLRGALLMLGGHGAVCVLVALLTSSEWVIVPLFWLSGGTWFTLAIRTTEKGQRSGLLDTVWRGVDVG